MSTVSIRLPAEIEQLLEQEAALTHRNRSELVREAITEYVARRERERFLGEIAEAARCLARNEAACREALEIAEDLLPLENEALDTAEGLGTDGASADAQPAKWWK